MWQGSIAEAMGWDARSAAVGVACGIGVCEVVRLVVRLRRTRGGSGGAPVKESTIRLMTRIAMESGAVNLSQGFPNEAPPRAMTCAAAGALLAGESAAAAGAMAARLEALFADADASGRKRKDALNQYSFPYGAPELRSAIQRYYARWYPSVEADAAKNVTVVMGATEGFAASIRALTEPGDAVAFFEPFHELYPSQLAIFGLEPRAVTLRADDAAWSFDARELDEKLRGAKLLLFNDPHNPTGHRFSDAEKDVVAELCAKHDVVCVTDEIYEHIYFEGDRYESLAARPDMRSRTVVVNSISKTAKATGWRIGWVVASEARTAKIRAVHDQLVACCPTPLQLGVAALLGDEKTDATHLAAIADEYRAKRDALAAALRTAGFVLGPVPKGSYYLFVAYGDVPALRGMTPTEAALHMTREVKVACVPGDNFYLGPSKLDKDLGQKYLRFAFVHSLDVIEDAARNLAALRPPRE